VKRLLLIFLFFFFNSCFDQNDCLITSTNLVQLELDNLSGTTLPTTFMLVEKGDSSGHFSGYENIELTSLALPLDPTKTQSSFKFVTSDTVAYHLTLGYTTFTRVISTDCGAFLYFRDLKVIETDFDSTRVTAPELFIGVEPNLKIFF
jgi:hypothetical protein